MGKKQRKRIVFVCMGNICRSPTAEAIFRNLLNMNNLSSRYLVESRGTTAWHEGEPADERAAATALQHGVEINNTARQLQPQEADDFDMFICMDRDNVSDVLALGVSPGRVFLLRDFEDNAESPDVPDPYYGGTNGFENVFRIINTACLGLLRELEK